MLLFNRSSSQPQIATPHPHAHQIGMAAVLIGLLGMPMAYTLILPACAIALGLVALMLSRHPAPGMNARPEGWVAVATGVAGLVFGGLQLLLMIHIR